MKSDSSDPPQLPPAAPGTDHPEPGGQKPGLYSVGTLTYTKAGLFLVFGWLLWGDFCFSLFESIGGPGILVLYLQDNFRVSNVQTNIIFSIIPMAIGIIVGPMIAFKSDRHRGPRGRRIPFIIWTTPFLCLFAAGCGFADEIILFSKTWVAADSLISPFAVAMILISFLVIGFSFFNEFVNTVFWFLFADVVPRQFLGRFLGLFRAVGAGAGFIVNVAITEHSLTHMKLIHVGVAALYFIGFSLMCWRVKEGEYPPVTDVGAKTTFFDQVKLYFRECFTHPIFLLVYATTFVSIFSSRMAGISGVWGLHLGQHVASAEAHVGATGAIAMTPDGARVLTVGTDGAARLWDGQAKPLPSPWYDSVRRNTLQADESLTVTGPALYAAALAPDGSWAAVADATDGAVRVWRPRSGGKADGAVLAGQSGAVRVLAVSPDGTRLAAGGADKHVRLWEMPSGTLLQTMDGSEAEVRALTFSRDGRRLASGGLDGKVRIHDAATGAEAIAFATPGPVYALVFMPALSAPPAPPPVSPTGTGLRILDVPVAYAVDVFTNETLYNRPPDKRSTIEAEDAWLVTGGQADGDDTRNAPVQVWAVADGKAIATMKGHKQAISALAYKPDLRLVVSGSLDKTLRVWDPVHVDSLASDHSVKSISGYTEAVTALATPEKGPGVMSASGTGSLDLWNIDAGISLRKMGLMMSFFGLIGLILAYPFGCLVDRLHALRVTLWATVAGLPIAFLTYFFVYDYATIVWFEVFKVPIMGIAGAASIPLLISIFPKEKYGQMCSANGLVKQSTQLVFGLVGALLMDWLTSKTLLTENYRYGYLWLGLGSILQVGVLFLLYRKWKALGGDAGYQPPEGSDPAAPAASSGPAQQNG